MERVTIDDVDSWMGPADVKRPIGKALDTEHVALNYYELEPGESFAFGYHAHGDQEEIFYVLEGTATFETESGDVEVAAGELVRFEPGEFQQGNNEGDERVRALAIGAPAETTEFTMLKECPECGERTDNEIQPTEGRDALVTVCQVCGGETGRFT